MGDELKIWKWMVPAGAVPVLFSAVVLLWMRGGDGALFCGSGLVGLMAILAVQGWAGFRAYYRQIEVDQAEQRKRMATTDMTSVRLEAARGVHPDVVRRLIEEAHRVWALKAGNRDMRIPAHSVLYHAPEVTDFFVVYVLRNSSDQYVMSKRALTEGRKNKFDPWGAVDEYTMFDSLMRLWAAEGRVIKYSDWEPYAWVQPWGPQAVAEDYGLDISAEEDEQPVDESEVEKI